MHKLLGFTQSDFDPAARFRFIQLIPYLREAGWDVTHRPNRPDRQWQSQLQGRVARGAHYRAGRRLMKFNRYLDVGDAGEFDVVFTNRDLAGPGLLCERRLYRKNPRIIYDFDDALFVGPNEDSVAWMCAHAAWVTPGNEYLAAFARQHTERVTVIPTIIDTDAYEPRTNGGNGQVRVGWSGSDQSIGTTLRPRLETLARLQADVDFELVVMTNTRPQLDVPGLRWSFVPWRAENEPQLGNQFDIGIMPLQDDAFQRGKCGLKLLQYMAAGLPTVASPVGVNESILQHGSTGLHARSEAEWNEALGTLVHDHNLRAAMGSAGRKRCVDEYSIRRWLPVLLDILERVRGTKP
jgi:glycosyltransferase involved in cell wall biosynthesis